MLPIVYGSFLRKNNIARYRYEKMKPSLLLLGNCLVAFALSGALVSAAFLAYEKCFNLPVKDYDPGMLKQHKELNNELIQQTALIREARPEGIDVKDVIQRFLIAKPPSVTIVSLSIAPNRYMAKCQSKELGTAELYANSLDFGRTRKAALGNIQQVKDFFEFSIEVADKTVPQKNS